MNNLEQLYGIYEMHKIETFKNGELQTERAKSGMFVFMRDHTLSVVSGSTEWVMAYTGTFEVKGDVLSILANSCVVREREGTTMTRKILKLDGEWLVLEAGSSEDEIRSDLTWKKKVSL